MILLNVFKILIIIKEIEMGLVNFVDYKLKSWFFIILVVNYYMYYVNLKILINLFKYVSYRYLFVLNIVVNIVLLYRFE